MGVFAGGGIDFSAISAEMRKTVLPWMNATIQIVDPDVGDVEWDVVTNTQVGGTKTVIWSGAARVQHLKPSNIVDSSFGQTDIRGIRIQIPFDDELGLLRKGLQVIVTDGGSDPVLEQLGFVIKSSVNSSYAWGRTIECDVDMKSVSNSTWATVSGLVQDDSTGDPIVGATVRSFHYADGVWLFDYETTTDVLGNYELPADVGVDIIVGAFASGYVTEYYSGSATQSGAAVLTIVNHEQESGINFTLVAE